MTLPIKPYSKTLQLKDAQGRIILAEQVSGYRQKRPYNVPTTYTNFFSTATYINPANVSLGLDALTNIYEESQTAGAKLLTTASNRAYERMVGRLTDAASWGATATAERKDTFGMLCTLLEKALLSARKARRGDILGVSRVLGVPYSEKTVVTRRRRKGKKPLRFRKQVYVMPDGREVARTAGSAWLLWSYGISPLMGDMYTTAEALQAPLPSKTIRGGGKADRRDLYQDGTFGSYYSKYLYNDAASVRCSVTVTVTNPDIWLLNRMGLVNPVQWANEAIPFSFIVDWFSNLSSVIGSLTDFYGLRLTNPTTTVRFESTYEQYVGYPSSERRDFGFTRKYERFQRTLAIPIPKLQFAYERFSVQRGLNALSLLLVLTPKRQPQ